MPRYRDSISALLLKELFITDGGIETTLIFHDGEELPYFAAYDLLKAQEGTEKLRKRYGEYAKLAQDYKMNLILESATWRGSRDWGDKLGYSPEALVKANIESIELLEAIRDEYETEAKIIISGCVGPRGDGYIAGEIMTALEAEEYHTPQIQILQKTNADVLTAMTVTYSEEAIGICLAAKKAGMPVVISFTVETDGSLPTGQSLKSAIEQVDVATGETPLYYMINCAHPTHFEDVIMSDEPWICRIGGIRANASCKSHAELEESETLDDGNPAELGKQCTSLRTKLPKLKVLGGCCGTDPRHIEAICVELGKEKAPQ